jgi:hypothetical protein
LDCWSKRGGWRIADAAFDQVGPDRCPTGALGTFLLELGRAVCRSWDSDFQHLPRLPRLRAEHRWPAQVELRLPEGYAFYALYPEAYIEAARRLKLDRAPRVIGIRSIGTSLAAVVAAAIGARSAVTVRPFGDPFERKIAVDPALEHELLQGDAHYIIVDEGPGQSGSSFGSVADWLENHGVPRERIALLPSHAGAPGAAATEERRRWWSSAERPAGDFGERWPDLIRSWCSALLGVIDEEPLDISGGTWRQLRYAREDDWPPTVPIWERRKFLVRAGGEPFLFKFAGFGRVGAEKLAIARTLHGEGFVPEPIGLVHGFLVERWCEGAAPLLSDDRPLARIAQYIGRRATLLPAPSGSGATIDQLFTMIRRNISLEFGEHMVRGLERWSARAPQLERRIVRVRTDNRIDRHEWLRTKAGALIKTDALDHHQAHDLIGCQDLAWDCAAAMVEFDVSQAEATAFIGSIEESANRGVDCELLGIYRLAYLGFRLGQARLGAATVSDSCERQRIEHSGDRFAAEIQHLLQSDCVVTRP